MDKPAEPDRFWTPLSNQNFRNFWLAFTASNLGTLIQAVAAAWMMTTITTSEDMVALVQAFSALPVMLFSVLAGAIADNFDRRSVMLISQLFMFAASATLAVLTVMGVVTPWTLLTFTFLIGCGTAFNQPSWHVTIGDLVPRASVPNAVSINSIAVNITRSVGPAIGGAILAVGGAAIAFAINAASYVAMIAVLWRWRAPERTSHLPREFMLSAIWSGMRYVSMSPNLIRIYFRALVFGLSSVATLALMPLVARDVLQAGPLTYGLLLCSFGIGAIIAALVNAPLRSALSSEAIIKLSFAASAFCALSMANTSMFPIASLAAFMGGASWVIALSLLNTLVQLSTPRWVVGRSLAFYQTASFGGMTIGSWFWGSTATSHGITTALTFAGCASLGGLALGLVSRVPDLENSNLDPLNHFKEPELNLDILPRSGPIAIQISYEIDDKDLEQFLDLMAWRRRIRIRDGARGWVLMRDLENPQRWMEMYHTPTWADYVRHNHRRTVADADNSAKLAAIHRGRDPISAKRMIEREAIPEADDVFYQHFG